MARWDDSFLAHVVVNRTLIRALYEESDAMIEFKDFVPAQNMQVRELLDIAPLYFRMPTTPPLCAACRKETL